MARAVIVLLYSIVIAMMMLVVWYGNGRAQTMAIVTSMPCTYSKDLVKHLKEIYHEQTAGGGLTNSGDQIRLFKSDKNTFTIVLTKPGGISCIIGSGGDWVSEPAKINGNDL